MIIMWAQKLCLCDQQYEPVIDSLASVVMAEISETSELRYLTSQMLCSIVTAASKEFDRGGGLPLSTYQHPMMMLRVPGVVAMTIPYSF